MRTPRAPIFFLILGLVASGILLAAAQYGEESDSLGQFVDEFTDLNNVSVRVLVERNSTLDVIELNWTAPIGGPEDFLTYWEQDENNDLTINATHIDFDTMRRDANATVYREMGIGAIGNFVYNFTLMMSAIEAGDASGADGVRPMIVSNANLSIGGLFALGVHADHDYLSVEIRQEAANDNLFRWRVRQITNGVQTFVVTEPLGTNNPMGTYYCTLLRSGTTVTLDVYSDLGRTVLDSTHSSGSADTSAYRYVGLANHDRDVSDAADHMTGSAYDFWLGGSPGFYASEGYFTTTNYLDNVNGSTLALMTQTRIFPNTWITVQFSDDNATWGDAQGVPGDSHDLDGGLETIDLRPLNESSSFYVRVNETTSDPAVTPYFNQSRLITTEGPAGAAGPGAPGLNVSRETVIYNLTEIGVTVGTLDSGNLNSTLDIDGDVFNVSEVVGAPGMQISGNFSGVDPDAGCLWVVIYAHYDGNLNHDFDIEVWNFTSSAWVEDSHIPDMMGFDWINSTIYALRIPNEFLSGGEVRVRLDHEAAGNINHDLFIEYFKLLAEIPAGPAPGAGTVTIVETDPAPWIAIAIILMCVAYLLFRPR